MDQVAKSTCDQRFELRITAEHARRLAWLSRRLNRSGNSILREALDRMYAHEEKVMLIQAGVWQEGAGHREV